VCFVVQEHQIAAHEQLYQDAIRRRLRQEEMAHWFPEDVTFQPTLETGGHHADSAKVMADPTVNVSDRSAVFVGDYMANVSDRSKITCDVLRPRMLPMFVGDSMINVLNRSATFVHGPCVCMVNVAEVSNCCAWSMCLAGQPCLCMIIVIGRSAMFVHGQYVGQVSNLCAWSLCLTAHQPLWPCHAVLHLWWL
jgi:hypothetical protein